MSADLQIVLCTTPDRETAEMIADALVSEQLAACVNILPGVMSVYRWQGTIEHSEESLLLIKTSQTVWPMLVAQIQALHPYELPEIVAVPIKTGEAEYIQWLENSIPSS
jgi:periplasmic divalent cation tolerance protein